MRTLIKKCYEYRFNNHIGGLFEAMCDKSDFGSDRERLNAKEQVFFTMAKLEMEVSNGAIWDFPFFEGLSMTLYSIL